MMDAPPCPSGLRIKSAMTVRVLVVLSCCCPALWFPAYAGMTVRDAVNDGPGLVVLLLPRAVDSRLRGNDGPGLVGLDLLSAPRCGYCLKASMTTTLPCPSGLRIKSAMTGRRPVDSRLREGK